MPPPPRLRGGEWAAPGTGDRLAASPLLWLLCRIRAAGLCVPQGFGKATALGLAGLGHGGTAVAEHRSPAKVGTVAAPDHSNQFAVAGDAGQVVASLSVPGPVVLLAGSRPAAAGGRAMPVVGRDRLHLSLARWSCRRRGPSPYRNRMRGSPLLCPRRPPLSFPGTWLAGATGLLIQLPAGGRRVLSSSHLPPSHLEHPSPSGHLPVGPPGPLRVCSPAGAA